MGFDLLANINDLCFKVSEHSTAASGLCGLKHTVVPNAGAATSLILLQDIWTVCSKSCRCGFCTLDKSLSSIPRKQCFPPLCHSPTKAPASHSAWLAAPNFSANPSSPVLTRTQHHLQSASVCVVCIQVLHSLRTHILAESCRYCMDLLPATAWSQT